MRRPSREGGAGFGGPDDELLVGVADAGEGVPVQGEVADQRVPQHLAAPAGDLTPDAAIRTPEAIDRQRTAEARGAKALITGYIPGSPEEREQAGITDIDIVEAVDYYTTPRGQHPNSPNKLRFSGLEAAFGFDAFHLAEVLLTQPLQVIVGRVGEAPVLLRGEPVVPRECPVPGRVP